MHKRYTLLILSILMLSEGCRSPETGSSASGTEFDEVGYLALGEKVVSQTFTSLSGHLQKAMQEGGVAEAAQYCNVRALSLTDSIANAYGIHIRRVSDKTRNPINKPGPVENEIITLFKDQLKKGITLTPQVRPINAMEIGYYAPIIVMAPCLQCHGKLGKTLKEKDYAYLKEIYPADKAIGYEAGDLRGIWSVTIKKDSSIIP